MAARTTNRSAASAVMLVAAVIAAILVLGIILYAAEANARNSIVNLVYDVARFFGRPFDHLFERKDPKQYYLLNWGLAALVYLLIGAVIARFVRRA